MTIQQARRVAAKTGFRVSKSRDRQWHCNNHQELQLIDDRNVVVLGVDFDASPEDVVEFCHDWMENNGTPCGQLNMASKTSLLLKIATPEELGYCKNELGQFEEPKCDDILYKYEMEARVKNILATHPGGHIVTDEELETLEMP